MSFYLGDLLVDRAINGVAENSKGELLYNLTNLQSLNISITADSQDAVDGTGAIIKTFYRGKQGELTATNSTLSLPMIASMGGTDPQYAGAGDAAIVMPRIVTGGAAAGATSVKIVLPGLAGVAAADFKGVVNAVAPNGALGDKYAISLTAGATGETGGEGDPTKIFSFVPADGTTDAYIEILNLTEDGDRNFIVKYDRTVTENGAKIVNRSDKFPKSVKLTIKVLICDPCETDVIRAAYVVIPNFQPSPELNVDFTTDATLDYTGRLMTSYCGTEKVLYEIYVCADDIEEE